MNQYKWSRKRIQQIVKNPKHPLRKKLGLRNFFDKLYKDSKQVIATEDIEKQLKFFVQKTGCPLGFTSGYEWIKKKYFGISRRSWENWLKGLESWQLLRRRKFNLDKKKDVTMTVLKKGAHTRIGFDLIEIGKNNKAFRPGFLDGTKFILVVVDKLTGFVWASPQNNKTANHTLEHWKKLLPDIKRKVGNDFSTESDKGKEFNKIRPLYTHYDVKLSSFVENMNSTIMRYMVMLEGGFKSPLRLPQLLPKVLKKINNIKGTRTKQTPADAIKMDKGEIFDNRKQTSKATGIKPSLRTKYKKGEYVRYNTSNWKDGFYKSFTGLKKIPDFEDQEIKTKFKPHWSPIYKITAVRRMGESIKYRVNTKWYFQNEIQVVPGPTAVKFRKEEKVIKKVVKKSGKPKKIFPRAKSTRIRKRVVRLGMVDYSRKRKTNK